MKLLSKLEKCFECWFVIGISCIFFLLRLPSLFEPYWYGDEGIYQTMGLALSRGALLYKEIWDNKPPLLYILYGLFAGDQFYMRGLSLLFGLLSVFLFFLLAKKICTRERTSYIATGIYVVLFGTPLLEGNIANAENFMVVPILAAGYLIYTTNTLKQTKILFAAGIFSSLAFLFKIVGLFDFAAFFVFLIIIHTQHIKNSNDTLKWLIPYIAGFILAIVLTGFYFLINGSFPEFYQGAFTQMVGYVGYGNYFIIPQGLLVIKLFLLSLFLLFLFFKRTSLSRGLIFILCWLAFSLFNAFFAQRPYIHYLLVLLPSFSLFAGYVMSENKLKIPTMLLFSFVVFLVLFNFNLYDKTFSYYKNFWSFATQKKNVMEYYGFFDRNTPRDYQLAQFISMNTSKQDAIFIWGNNAQVYKMTGKLPPGRFTVAYHIAASKNTLSETEKKFFQQKPKLIVITSPSNPFPYSLMGYAHRITIEETAIYERIY